MKDNHTEQYAGNSIPNVAPSHTVVFTSCQIFISIKRALPVLAQISIACVLFLTDLLSHTSTLFGSEPKPVN